MKNTLYGLLLMGCTIQQTALLGANEPDTAYYHDAGLQISYKQDIRVGGNMWSSIRF